MENVYGFTTTESDQYLTRVIAEAPKKSSVIIVKEAYTVPTETGNPSNLYVLVKAEYLDKIADQYPNHVFLKHELGEVVMDAAVNSTSQIPNYYVFERLNVASGEELYQQETFIFNEVNRLKNLGDGRIVKVAVATL